MLSEIPERTMHIVRWILTIAWILLIASLFIEDPISQYLTNGNVNDWFFLRIKPHYLDPVQCREWLLVQGKCIQKEDPYYFLGAKIFWGMVIPSAVMMLLVFGHELWRRICPLSFLSQIPRALGIQRQRKVVNPKTGVMRYELAKIGKDSWLGRNHLYFQFCLLTAGLAIRILFVNSNRVLLASLFIVTIIAAITVGYLYAGKSWCQYFCPMAPVQRAYHGPRAIFGSPDHLSGKKNMTQSMCRNVDSEGKEKSACVGCQSPCVDIDSERSYWDTMDKPGRKFSQYGYVGLVLGFYLYYAFYSGTLDYYYSGAWNYEDGQLGQLFNPGFYFGGYAIDIPKLVAAPLTLIAFIALSIFLFSRIEKFYKSYLRHRNRPSSQQHYLHKVFTLSTFVVFNIYFIWGGRPVVRLLPFPTEIVWDTLPLIASTVWLLRTWNRTPELYSRESLAVSLRRQLSKLTIDFSQFLEGRSLEDLQPNEVYVLATVLPNYNREYGLQVYKGMLREALEQGHVNSANSLEVLKQIRLEFRIQEEEHFQILTEVGIEDPQLLDPTQQRSQEHQLRIASYREAIELQLLELVEQGIPLREALERKQKQILALKREYGITAEEEAQVISGISGENSTLVRTAESLMQQLRDAMLREKLLKQLEHLYQSREFALVRIIAVEKKQAILIQKLLNILEILHDNTDALKIAQSLSVIAETALPTFLKSEDEGITWEQRLHPKIMALLHVEDEEDEEEELDTLLSVAPDDQTIGPVVAGRSAKVRSAENGKPEPQVRLVELPSTQRELAITILQDFVADLDPLIQTAGLSALVKVTPEKAKEQAQHLLFDAQNSPHWLVKEVATNIVDIASEQSAPKTEQVLIVRIVSNGKTHKQVFPEGFARIGRSKINNIILDNERVAQQHAVLQFNQQGAKAIDLNSPSGLYINDKIIHNRSVKLEQGSEIRFGPYEEPALTIRWGPKVTDAKPASASLGTFTKLLLLFDSPFFQTLNPDALIEIAKRALVRSYPRGAKLCEEGEQSDGILLLFEGSADIAIQKGKGLQIINAVQAGETIGEMGVLTRKKRSATAIASSDETRVLVIPSKDFEYIMAQNTQLARNLVLMLSSRLQRLTAKLQARIS